MSKSIGEMSESELKDFIIELQEENTELEHIVGIREKRGLISKFDKEFDEEDKKKNPNRDYVVITPDAEEVYKRYYELKDNWQELKDFLEEKWQESQDIWYVKIINKMREIENGSSSRNI